MKIAFFFRISQGNLKAQKGLGSITYIITQKDTKPLEKSTGIKCNKSEWDDDSKCFIGSGAASKNFHLEKIKLDFENNVNQKDITQSDLQGFVELVKPNIVKLKLFTDVFSEYVENQRLKIRKENSPRTKQTIEKSTFASYQKRYQNIEQFLKVKKLLHLNVNGFNAMMCESLDLWITTTKGFKGDSRGQLYATKHLKLVQAVMEFARKNKYITVNYATDYKLKYEPEQAVKTISDKALHALEFYEGYSETEQKYVDAFLFMRECCMHVGDYCELNDSHLDIDDQGEQWIVKQRVKREVDGRQIQVVPLSEKAVAILNKYGSLSSLPRANHGSMRYYLKMANMKCGNTERITLKYARSNGISNLYNNNKTRSESIAIVAGLTTTKQLKAYLKIDFNLMRREVLNVA